MPKIESVIDRAMGRASEIAGVFLPYQNTEEYERYEARRRDGALAERVGSLMLAEGTVQNHTYNGLQNRVNAMLDLMPGRSHEILATSALVDEHLGDGKTECEAIALGHELLDITRQLHHES